MEKKQNFCQIQIFFARENMKNRSQKLLMFHNWIFPLTALSCLYGQILKIYIVNWSGAPSVLSTLWFNEDLSLLYFWAHSFFHRYYLLDNLHPEVWWWAESLVKKTWCKVSQGIREKVTRYIRRLNHNGYYSSFFI